MKGHKSPVVEVKVQTRRIRTSTDIVLMVSELVTMIGVFTSLWLDSGLGIAAFGFVLLSSSLSRIQIAIENRN